MTKIVVGKLYEPKFEFYLNSDARDFPYGFGLVAFTPKRYYMLTKMTENCSYWFLNGMKEIEFVIERSDRFHYFFKTLPNTE